VLSEPAELYDLIYSRCKDYPAETHQLAELLGKVHARCRTILDVACGTAEHAYLLATHHGFEVDGCVGTTTR
jgi:ubiquinone/menaquinone biosynthesis C-methylase UbiE